MTNPAISYIEFFKLSTGYVVTAESAELVQPQEFSLMDWIAKGCTSVFESVVIVTGKNDAIKFQYADTGNGITLTDFTAYIPAGQYWVENLASEAMDAMNNVVSTVKAKTVTNISVRYVPTSKVFQIFTTGSTLKLYCATADNPTKQRSAYNTLGFDCTTDKSGALSYMGIYIITASWGDFTITSSNNTFQVAIGGSFFTISIAVGLYNVRSLQTQIKYQMDVAMSITTTDAVWDESTHVFTLKRSTAPLSIKAGGTFLDVIGFTRPVGGTDYTGAAFYPADEPRIHTEWWVKVILPVAIAPRVFFALGCSITSAAVVSYMGHNSNFDPANPVSLVQAPRNFIYDPYILIDFYAAPIALAYWAIRIVDRKNSNGWVGIGKFSGGDYISADGWEQYDATLYHENKSVLLESDGGQVAGVRNARIANRNYEFEFVREEARDTVDDFLNTVGNNKAFLLTLDPDGDPAGSSLWCLFRGDEPQFKRVPAEREDSIYPYAYHLSFEVREQK